MGGYIDESLLRKILIDMPTKYLDLSRSEVKHGPGTIELDIQVHRAELEGLCISGCGGSIIWVAMIMSMLNNVILQARTSKLESYGETYKHHSNKHQHEPIHGNVLPRQFGTGTRLGGEVNNKMPEATTPNTPWA